MDRILASPRFAKAHRLAALLRFLVGQSLTHGTGTLKEYAIGIEVFGRSPASYHTGEDPIVRVQVGRLRTRLAEYYADEGRGDPVRITIPLGGYAPRIESVARLPQAPPRLVFAPFACLSTEPPARALTLGLNEELSYRLHRDFGLWVTSGGVPAASGYLVEGSVRVDGARVRIALRLRDLERNNLVCSEQFDATFSMSLEGQERLADACHRTLLRHLHHSLPGDGSAVTSMLR